MDITGLWLRREGIENDPKADAVVLIEVGGQWVEVVRERCNANFSHIVEESGLKKARNEAAEQLAVNDLVASGGIVDAP